MRVLCLWAHGAGSRPNVERQNDERRKKWIFRSFGQPQVAGHHAHVRMRHRYTINQKCISIFSYHLPTSGRSVARLWWSEGDLCAPFVCESNVRRREAGAAVVFRCPMYRVRKNGLLRGSLDSASTPNNTCYCSFPSKGISSTNC